jgi:hypothetical protein
MPKSNLSEIPILSQEKYRVTIQIPRNRRSVQAVRLESECLSLCLSEAWRLVHHPPKTGNFPFNPKNTTCKRPLT